MSGRKGKRESYLGSLIGLQRQELGLLQSSGNLAECCEEGRFTETGWGPNTGAGKGHNSGHWRPVPPTQSPPTWCLCHQRHLRHQPLLCSILWAGAQGWGRGFPIRASLLRDIPMGPSSLSLHTSGGHINNFDVRIPQAPVEAQAMAGTGHGVRRGYQRPSKQVQGGSDIRTRKTGSQDTV